MRLTSQQVNLLHQAFTPFLQKKTAELYLYGSRVHDHLKGGDIDLLLLFKNAADADQIREEKHRVLAHIKKLIGDQKIDLTIAEQSEIQSTPFLQMIMQQAVLLHHFC